MDEYIVLADGTQIGPCHILPMTDREIILYVDGKHTIAEMFNWFSDPEATATITAYRFGEEQTFTGYTELYSLRIENDSLATACLRKGTNDNA